MVERARHSGKDTTLFGVFLFVIDQDDNVLVFQNKITKESTQKVRGQITTPAESLEVNSFVGDIPRMIDQEVGKISTHSDAKFRGIVRINLERPIMLTAFEIRVDRKDVTINPQDTDEIGPSQWIPLNEIDETKLQYEQWKVPVFRSPIPEFAQNLRAVRRGEKYPVIKQVGKTVPKELYEFLENNPCPDTFPH